MVEVQVIDAVSIVSRGSLESSSATFDQQGKLAGTLIIYGKFIRCSTSTKYVE